MNGLHIHRSIHIQASFTAEDWQLYTDFPDEELGEVVDRLNHALEAAVHRSETRGQAMFWLQQTMDELSKYGAQDSECRWFAIDTLKSIYGEE